MSLRDQFLALDVIFFYCDNCIFSKRLERELKELRLYDRVTKINILDRNHRDIIQRFQINTAPTCASILTRKVSIGFKFINLIIYELCTDDNMYVAFTTGADIVNYASSPLPEKPQQFIKIYGTEADCPICFESEGQMTALTCGHIHCLKCVQQIAKCSLCNKPLSS